MSSNYGMFFVVVSSDDGISRDSLIREYQNWVGSRRTTQKKHYQNDMIRLIRLSPSLKFKIIFRRYTRSKFPATAITNGKKREILFISRVVNWVMI